MPVRLLDDGTRVTLDLHGARVEEAEALLRNTVRLAVARGRATLEVIHGASTSDPDGRNRTVKHAVHALLDAGALPDVSAGLRREGSTLLSLPVGRRPDTRRLTLLEVR